MYQMPVKAIKNILRKKLEGFEKGFFDKYPDFIMQDVQKEMVYIAYTQLLNVLEKSNDYASLDDYLFYAGYRMSLEDWINSL